MRKVRLLPYVHADPKRYRSKLALRPFQLDMYPPENGAFTIVIELNLFSVHVMAKDVPLSLV